MVTATAQPAFHSPLLGETTGLLTLRVQGTEHDGRVLRIRSTKCLIGSDPTCTLRLRSATVRPFHCLILQGAAGTFIRRWSPDTCLNGCGFDEARLHPGDRISVGAIELEVLPSTPLAVPEPPLAPPPERDQDEATQLESLQECQRLRDELLDVRQEHQRLQSLVQRQEQKDRETEAGYRTLIEELRSTITSSKTVCHDQLIEHKTLANQAEAAAGQLELLQGEIDRLQRELDAERYLASNSRTYLEAEQIQSEAYRQEIQTLRFQVTQAAARAAEQAVSPPAPRSVPEDSVADVATWKDVADGLRRELQQTREEHRRVREEWHVDRESLERELNHRSIAAQQLEQKYKQDMCEAEMLIHAMQQEGKNLLVQLDEVKQSIRQGGDGYKKKRPSLVHTVRSLVADAAGPLTPQRPGDPLSKPPLPELPEAPIPVPQSACPTMLMGAPLEVDEPAMCPPPAAESPPIEPHVPTLALSPSELPQAVASTPDVPAGDVSPAAAGDPESDDDEGAIQRYMDRLLHRVARVREDRVPENSATSPPVAAIPMTSQTSGPEAAPVREASLAELSPLPGQGPPAPVLCPANEAEMMSAVVTSPASPPAPSETLKPRSSVPPELAADLLAMRQLANRTVQHHVDRSGDRQSMVAAAGDFTVGFVCLAFGVLVSASGSGVLSAETLGGAIGIAFGTISLLRGLRTCLQLQKKRSEARRNGTA
ncbi:MAG: FHA domain-containing protein [Pirellulaceae bacterium]